MKNIVSLLRGKISPLLVGFLLLWPLSQLIACNAPTPSVSELESVTLHLKWYHLSLGILSGLLLAALGGSVLYLFNKRLQQSMAQRTARSEAQYRSLFNNAINAILIADSGAHYVAANPAACKLLEYTEEELLNKSVSDVLAPGVSWDIFQTLWQQFMEVGRQSGEIQLNNKAGQIVEIEYHAVANFLPGRHLSVLQDITERKRAEELLRESEARFRAVWDVASDAMVLLDGDGMVIAANPAYVTLYGRPLEEVIGHNFNIVFPPEQRAAVLENYRQVFANPHIQPVYETEIKHANDNRMVVESRIGFVTNAAGQRKAMLSITRDITRIKQAQDQLRQLSKVVEQNPAAIIITNTNGDIEYVNPAFATISGYSSAEAVGRNPRFLKSGLTPPEVYKELRPTVLAGNTYRCEFCNKKKQGELFWVQALISPIKDDHDQITHILCIQEDITERKQFEQERARLETHLRQAQRLETIGTLAGGIAHDFNNILTPIIGYTELTLAQFPNDHPVCADLERVLKGALRAKDLVQQILTFSRQVEQERMPIELQSLIKEVLTLLRPSLPATIEIRREISPDCGPIRADPAQIHQILMNLCTNAYQAMDDNGGAITIGLVQIDQAELDQALKPTLGREAYACLKVTDTGPGMDAATLDRVFEPFFTTKPPGQGTGLGLSVVHGIVKGHEGAILAKSTPGRGTTFELYFPISTLSTLAEIGQIESPGQKMVSERILVVDDEPIIVDLISQWLTKLGYQVIGQTSSASALELYRADTARFDLVITDLTMPHITGLKLAQQMTALRPDLPVILITGYGDRLSQEELHRNGVKKILMKPILFNNLNGAIRQALN
ncbi:MAG: PAS domain S-box protein [Anaerolineae bacterium]|nr:PAS domain S-box protein [Anaerolineae bacterium]